MRKIINFNENWKFLKATSDINADLSGAELISLPHSWNALDGQDGGNDYFRGSSLYVKEFTKKSLGKAKRYYVEIQGANSSADLYLNGTLLAHHDGGYSTWRVDLTESLLDENKLVVVVDNAANDRVYPQVADFTFYGGIYRDVNVITVDETHFDLDYYGGPGIAVTPTVEDKNASVKVDVYVTNPKKTDTYVYTLTDKEGNVVASEETKETSVTLTIENVIRWHGRKNPYLYKASVAIKRKDKEVDLVETRFGCRTFEIDPNRGFILNGEEYPLRGVSRHQDRLGIGNALLKEHHEEDMDLICEVGATTIRLAHYQHDQYFYDLCDERGMVVWAEIPYISNHMASGRANTISQMKELVIQNYNHPSIVVWGLSNEITMAGAKDPDLIENHKILNDLVHELDKTRLTTMAVVSMCSMEEKAYLSIPDVVSYNHYFGWYGGDTSMNGPWFDKFHARHPNIPVGVSEYGCEALNWHTSEPKQGDYTEEYQSYYHEELIKQLFSRPYLWATHVWNMFDFGADARAEGGENGQNHKGLVTMDRKYKKDSFYAYKAWLSDDPFVHICSKRYVDRVEEITKVTVYSNLPEVELFVNGESVGKQASDNHFFYFSVPNVGESTLVAQAGSYKDESKIRKVETFNEEYRLKEKGAVLNWFDVTTPEGRYSLNDNMGDILKSFGGKLWFAKLGLKMKKAISKKSGKKDKKENSGSMNLKFTSEMMQMLNGFTVLRLTGLVSMIGLEFTKEELLKMNKQLNRIRKPKSVRK